MSAGLGLIPLVRTKKDKNDSEVSREHNDTSERSSGCTNDNDTKYQQYDSLDDNNPLIEISSSSVSPVVIGRSQLLKSFRVACNREGGFDGEASYRETLQWGEKALSRKLLRFSDANMQTRGKHVVVRINGKPISSNLPENQDGWSMTSVNIKVGDIISFQPKGGEGLLEFRIEKVEPRIQMEKEWGISKSNRMAKPSLKRKRITVESTGPKTIDLTDDEEQGGTKKSAKLDSNLPRRVTLDDESQLKDHNDTNDSSTTSSSKTRSPPFLIHFFPFGSGTCMCLFGRFLIRLSCLLDKYVLRLQPSDYWC